MHLYSTGYTHTHTQVGDKGLGMCLETDGFNTTDYVCVCVCSGGFSNFSFPARV